MEAVEGRAPRKGIRKFIGLMAKASLGYLHGERCTALEGFMHP